MAATLKVQIAYLKSEPDGGLDKQGARKDWT
jgi:hypothetical protein